MAVARWNGMVIASSDQTLVVEGNHYFPAEAVDEHVLVDSPTKTMCYWKGIAHYKTLASDEDVLPDAVWYYPKPWPLARRIRGHMAFGRGVTITP